MCQKKPEHPNITRLIKQGTRSTEIYLVMDLHPRDTKRFDIYSDLMAKDMSERDTQVLFSQYIKALHFLQINGMKPKNPIERKSFLITESDKRLKLNDIYTYKEGTRPRQKHANLLVDIDKIVDFFLSAHLKDTRRKTSDFNLKTILQKDGLSLCFLDIVK